MERYRSEIGALQYRLSKPRLRRILYQSKKHNTLAPCSFLAQTSMRRITADNATFGVFLAFLLIPLSGIGTDIYLPSMPAMAQSLGGTAAQIQLTLTLFIAGYGLGQVLAGVLLDRFGWQSIFLMNLPFCLVAGVLGLYLLPRAEATVRQAFDWLGVGILCAGSLLAIDFIASIRQFGLLAPRTLLLIVLVALCAYGFVLYSRRAAAPIVSLSLFSERSFTMASLVTLAYGFGLYASTYLIPVFLQSALGYDATLAGLALLPSGLLLAVVIPLAGVLSDRYSPRWIMVWGLALFGLSFVLFAMRGGAISYAEVIGFSLIGRLGLGMTIPALMVATMARVAPDLLGQASMVSNYSRQFGGVIGVAIVAVFVEWRASVHGTTAPGLFWAYSQAFLLLALAFGLALVAALRMKPRSG